MCSLRLATDAETGLIHVLDRCGCHVVAHGTGKAHEAVRAILADPGDMARRHHSGQQFTARRARLRIMVDRGIRGFSPAQCRAWMTLRTAGFLA
jgi:hypothetical protein